jgi:hypothetical protein
MAAVTKTRVGNTPHAVTKHEETLRKDAYQSRKQEDVKVADSGRVAAARKAGPHGKSTNADGSSFSTPLNKKKTNAGKSGVNLKS